MKRPRVVVNEGLLHFDKHIFVGNPDKQTLFDP